jgi:membrane protein
MHSKRDKFSYNFHKYIILPLRILRTAIVDTIRHDGVEHAGYLAFLSLLSLFPSLIFLVAIIGLLSGSQDGIATVQKFVDSLPQDIAVGLAPRINEIISGPPQTFLTIAIVGIIWTASSSVEGCRTILNRAYRIAFPPPYIWRRLISIAQFFIIISALTVGISLFVVVPIVIEEITRYLPLKFSFDYNAYYLRHAVVFVLLVAASSTLYYVLPNAKQKITQTLPGSILTVLIWIGLEKSFLFYLENFHQFSLVYGSLAGVIVALMFFYLISLAFIFGAEFNYQFHRVYSVFLRKKKRRAIQRGN